ncbi:unnamed protein product [Sphacelaria rigidula]
MLQCCNAARVVGFLSYFFRKVSRCSGKDEHVWNSFRSGCDGSINCPKYGHLVGRDSGIIGLMTVHTAGVLEFAVSPRLHLNLKGGLRVASNEQGNVTWQL